MRLQVHCLILIAGLAGWEAGLAAEVAPPTPAPVQQPEMLDEVEVKGAALRALRAAAIKAEDRVVARYNELNQDDDLDIECLMVTRTGSRMSFRYCRTKLQKRAQQDDAYEWISSALTMQLDPGMGASRLPPAPPDTPMRLLARLDDYRKNLATMLRNDATLRELALENGAARRRYDAALPKFKAKRVD